MIEAGGRFSLKLQERLNRCGWHEGRRVEDDVLHREARPAIQEMQCRPFQAAFAVLQEFSGLRLANSTTGEDSDPHPLVIGPHACVTSPRMWFMLEWQFGEVLFPVADYGDGEMSLLIGSSGRVYGYGHGYWNCGTTFDQALENLKGSGSPIARINRTDLSQQGTNGKAIYDVLML